MPFENWKEDLEMNRTSKDYFFAQNLQSPIPMDERENFDGLKYYPPDPTFYFELDFHEHAKKESIQIQDTKENMRTLIRWGKFIFKIDGKEYILQAYKSDPNEKHFFVPFRDATSGKETYGAGKYLDLDEKNSKNGMGKWILDFNLAYNPFCAYNEDYACPFVTPENWLKVPILAGEKKYHD
ncbi:DUF1684 domain-containing protein [Promethearchaeum syntrophicum]|uniref:DUF1684 domain-containing protein n=1 Tax=Promethearchaeum syntrophicum TaxID=2594042 RepID=A0A5B9D5D1_9ARCH|nr:DUF1684 domain-containing protein [Candidatus Prometheoarchaeum syntrophicum]